MKRLILPIALSLIVAAGGCARFKKKPGEVVMPSGARMPPSTAPASSPEPSPPPAISATDTGAAPSASAPIPPEGKRRPWWKDAPREPAASGVATTKPVRVYRMKTGDPIVIALRGLPGSAGGQQNIDGILDENGCINLPFLNVVHAAGKTPSELEREIRDRYINEGYYRDLGVNIIIPSQGYFVRGEVRGPGRFQLVGGTTILQAIAAAGGYTEFANARAVQLLRGEQRIIVNMREIEKYPARDKELESGDVIIVPRSFY